MAFKKLNPSAKKIWIKALLSGKYQQTQETLKDEDGYCCLGVAQAEFCKVAEVKPNFKSNKTMLKESGNSGQSLATYYWLGLTPKVERKLADLNDNRGMSFSEIAAWIKRYL